MVADRGRSARQSATLRVLSIALVVVLVAEAAGVAAAVGRQVTRFKPGDRVACLSWIGGLGQRMVAKEWKSVRIPDAVSFEIAAAVIHSYGTAYYALVIRAQVQAGETVVVTGAGGGVGMAAVDLARHLGEGSSRWSARIVMRPSCASAG